MKSLKPLNMVTLLNDQAPTKLDAPAGRITHMTEKAHEHLEIERKYEVPQGATIPENIEGFEVGQPVTFHLDATYFDTPDNALAKQHTALRRRNGGDDAGWHLKIRRPEGVHETTWLLTDEPSEAMRQKVGELLGEKAELTAIATIRSTRVRRILSMQSEPVIELVDDTVVAKDERQGVDRTWREWEAELIDGADPAFLDQLEPALTKAGALVSLNESKIGRAVGGSWLIAARKGATANELASLAAADLADRLQALTPGDPRIAQLRRTAAQLAMIDRVKA